MKNTRHALQAGLLALTLAAVFLFRTNAEAWCPFGGVEAAYTYLREGNLLCSLGISNFYAFGALLLRGSSLAAAFCGYMCPIGAISEWFGAAGRRLGLRTFRLPEKLDRVLSLGKYAVLAAILSATWQLGELAFRGYCPAYALLSRHGADITFWAYVVAGAVAGVSLFLTMPFCRWFCPLAAVLNPVARLGLTRIKRDSAGCSNCGRCSASCPMAIPVASTAASHSIALPCLHELHRSVPQQGAYDLLGTAEVAGPRMAPRCGRSQFSWRAGPWRWQPRTWHRSPRL